MRNLKLVIFLGKLNNLELWGADIGNAYLEVPTEEKLYIVAGPEFVDWEGYILTFSKALYGLKSSGKRWAETLHIKSISQIVKITGIPIVSILDTNCHTKPTSHKGILPIFAQSQNQKQMAFVEIFNDSPEAQGYFTCWCRIGAGNIGILPSLNDFPVR